MNRYIQIEFQNISQQQSDILIAQLNEIGFEGFEEAENNLKAFILETAYNENLLRPVSSSLQLDFSQTIIEETNWNQVWESNFEPVIVDDFVAVRADFHEPIKEAAFEIVITPKMSFGTGHHATTYMMMQEMREIEFTGKTVLDFGTGTGVLAILAEKLGAESVLAIDNDSWSISNAEENIQRNDCTEINLRLADTAATNGNFDIILANINKNVILDNFQELAKQLLPGGILLLSGLLTEDKPEILARGTELNLEIFKTGERHNWLFIRLSR
jgi:ribosomal protein L11 methyltransferase